MSYKPLRTIKQKESDDSRDDDPGDHRENARWKAQRPTMAKWFGVVEVRSWLDHLVPLSDRDGVLLLGAPSQFEAEQCSQKFGHKLARIFECEVRIEYSDDVRRWKAAAQAKTRAGVD